MTCRVQANRSLSAAAIGFHEPAGERVGHVPVFSRPDLATGKADCLRCGKVIDAQEFLTGHCPGRKEATDG